MERLNYDGRELRDAFGWLATETARLEGAHAANWRRLFTQYTEGVRSHYEALRLLVRMLEGHAVDAVDWFRKAGEGAAPPPPEEGYPLVALVWKQISAAVQKPGEGFLTAAQVDFPYVLSMAFPGESLGERFHHWKLAFLDPYIERMGQLCEAVLAQAPGDDETVDLWDLAMPILQSLPGPGAPAGSEGGTPDEEGGESEPAATAARRTGRATSKTKAAKKSARKKKKPGKTGARGRTGSG